MLKPFLRRIYFLFCSLFFDPIAVVNKWRGLGAYFRNCRTYRRSSRTAGFPFSWPDVRPMLEDRYRRAGNTTGHYFWQDLWAARKLYAAPIKTHVDVGSRVDGFVAHILPFCQVTYVDIRRLDIRIDGLNVELGSIVNLPFPDGSIPSLSSLHVIEHIGLGRYGDPVDAAGHVRAARELVRVLAPEGRLLISVPVGRERLCFDAHRVFNPATILAMFEPLRLEQFSLIGDDGEEILDDARLEDALSCDYGCGLFVFRKGAVEPVGQGY